MEHYSALEKNEILSFATRLRDQEGVTLTEIRQRQMQYDFTYTRNLERKEAHTETDPEIQRAAWSSAEGKRVGGGEK